MTPIDPLDSGAVTARWPQLITTYVGDDWRQYINTGTLYEDQGTVSLLVFATNEVELVVSKNREEHLNLTPAAHDKTFTSIEAAMNYALIEGLLL